MSAMQIIDEAAAAGIQLEVEGGKLIVEFSGEAPDGLVTRLKKHKAEIVDLLREPPPPAPGGISQEAAALSALAEMERETYRRLPEQVAARGDPPAPSSVLPRDEPVLAHPSWWPLPHPRITREPPSGSDGVPPRRYAPAWGALLANCPSGMDPFVWEQAMYDAARLFGDWGIELERLAWKPDDLFDMPHGLVWFINGNYAAFIGAKMAEMADGCIWRASR